ncbi:MAG: hypothetical protein MJ197_07915 [Bacteroidales bacterium]|nr:hypothetical protein [Bacteroidales bacterium]
MKQDLSQVDLHEISSTIENVLKLTSIDTKIALLDGLLSRFNKDFLDLNICKIYNNKLLIFSNNWIKSKAVFFYQDYVLLTNEMIEKNFVVEVEKDGILMYSPYTLYTEEKSLKREYLLYAVVCNELIRLRRKKKGRWNGKIYECLDDFVPVILNQEQENTIIELYKKYWELGSNGITGYQYVTMVCNCNLSSLNISKQKKKLYCLIRELTEVLGESWGEKTAFNTTNGEKDLKAIKKNYYKL